MDINNLGSMMEMFKQFSNTTKTSTDQTFHRLEIDDLVSNQEMNVIKASIPYMNQNIQKQMAVIIKFLEFRNTMNVFNSEKVTEIAQLNKPKKNKTEILTAIRNQCTEKNRNTIDILLNVYNIKNLMGNYRNFSKLLAPSENNPQEHNPFTDQQDSSEPVSNNINTNNEENLSQEELIEKLMKLMNN